MALYKFADKIVFNILSNIKVGYIEITNYQGTVFKLGNPKDNLKARLKIKKPNFSFNLIKGGSIGFAESYMKGEFQTDNLPNLIEITARNIKIIHKFSGLLDFPIVNFFKSIFIKNTKNRSKENIAKHYDLGNDFFSLWLDK
ncbi:class I SAM-dependent methyltransferase, partial [Candidatus Pelagibacter sp.]|nr:class I SAM-dependent methyltransferase [Candidatus Pelagibacter sp.]